MDKNRLSESIRKSLNAQMTLENWASQVYLSYASWCSEQGYAGIANFLFRHAQEERNHMMKFLEYILERGASVEITAIPAPGPNPSSIADCFEKVFKQETDNTASIYKIVKQSFQEEDWVTWNFLQWFVKEQAEEETLALSLLDKIKIAGGTGAKDSALYSLDQELGKLPDEARVAQDVTADEP